MGVDVGLGRSGSVVVVEQREGSDECFKVVADGGGDDDDASVGGEGAGDIVGVELVDKDDVLARFEVGCAEG